MRGIKTIHFKFSIGTEAGDERYSFCHISIKSTENPSNDQAYNLYDLVLIFHVFLKPGLFSYSFGRNQGWKYRFRRIYWYLDFMDISDNQWIFLHENRYIGY